MIHQNNLIQPDLACAKLLYHSADSVDRTRRGDYLGIGTYICYPVCQVVCLIYHSWWYYQQAHTQTSILVMFVTCCVVVVVIGLF